jgi:hypothetical protein
MTTQWIAFDHNTARVLATRSESREATVLRSGQALDSALELDASVALLPAKDGAVFLLAIAKPSAHSPRPPERVATGFLGLLDELVYEEPPEPPRKWWQKLLE